MSSNPYMTPYGGAGSPTTTRERSQPYHPPQVYQPPSAPPGATPGLGWSLGDVFGTDAPTQPFIGQWAKTMQGLNQPGPNYGDLEDQFLKLSNTGPDPALTSIIDRLANYRGQAQAAGNPYSGQYAAQTKAEIARLHQNPFSSADEANLKARFFDATERGRTLARQQVLEQMGALGHAPTDGAVVAALQNVDKQFDQTRAQQQQGLLEYTTGERERRLAAAQGYSGQLAGFGEGAAQRGTSVNLANQQALLSALEAAGGLQGNDLARRGTLAFQGLSNAAELRRQGYQDNISQMLNALAVAQVPRNFASQEQATLTSLLNGLVPNASQVGSQYDQLAQLRYKSQADNAAGWSNLFNTGGKAAVDILNAYNG